MGPQSRGCSLLLYSLNKHLASVCWVQDPNPWWHGAETLVQGRREEDTDKSRRESEAAMDKTLRPGPVLSVGPGPLPRTAWEKVSPCLGWAMCLAGRLSRPSPAPCPLEESREALGPEVWEGARGLGGVPTVGAGQIDQGRIPSPSRDEKVHGSVQYVPGSCRCSAGLFVLCGLSSPYSSLCPWMAGGGSGPEGVLTHR